ncbi:RNA dependent RNA polymerase-domain-containing protein [Mycena crocata]|nr:RNA dependent RNA polymerase-domain-containing protein [Mycena crocata]
MSRSAASDSSFDDGDEYADLDWEKVDHMSPTKNHRSPAVLNCESAAILSAGTRQIDHIPSSHHTSDSTYRFKVIGFSISHYTFSVYPQQGRARVGVTHFAKFEGRRYQGRRTTLIMKKAMCLEVLKFLDLFHGVGESDLSFKTKRIWGPLYVVFTFAIENSSSNVSSPCKTPSPPITSNGKPFSLVQLFGGQHGSQLEVHIIAHSTEAQAQFDNLGVRLGVQWELARGVSAGKWTWEDVVATMKANFGIFRASNSVVASRVADIMRGRLDTKANNLSLWSEADREHEALKEGKFHGLGLTDDMPGYYGGQIKFPLRLMKFNPKAKGSYYIQLERPQRGRSHRFARELGSSSMLQLSIPLELIREDAGEVRRFLAQRFVINGRVYLPLPPKDKSSVYLVQINQDWDRTLKMGAPLAWFGDQHRISFDNFLLRHNPPALNSRQPFAKYIARFALGLSTSMPVVKFAKENIFYIPDVVADGWDPTKKPPAEKIMTDGCGFINRSALLAITHKLNYSSRPTAVQGRIGGAKGLWVLHPKDTDLQPKIWIRDSQRKIHLQGDYDIHRIFDLLKASHPSQTEGRQELSEQSILCLSFNGIPDEMGWKRTVKPLLNWAPDAMVSLWRAVNAGGNVSGSRIQRIAGSKSRVLGFQDREREQEAEVVDADDLPTSNRSGRNRGGGPIGLHEQAVELIQAGFQPSTSAYLNDKMRYIIKTEISSVVDKYRISLPESTASDAFVIPDPLGILKENEIYYRSSNPMKNPETQTLFQILEGPVIVTAVNLPQLYDWPDVIIASTAGKQSLLSLLSGGDTVIFIWLKEFVERFRNQPFTPPPADFMENFERQVTTVEDMEIELSFMPAEEAQRSFQEHLLEGLRDTQVGLYSFFHDNAIWRHGYSHPNSILMAYIGNTLLDAGKTGLCLKNDVFEAHQKKFGHKRPKTDNWKGPPRDDSSRPFILQTLLVPLIAFLPESLAGNAKGDEILQKYDRASGKLSHDYKEMKKDAALLRPYTEAIAKSKISKAWAATYKFELDGITRRIDEVLALYRDFFLMPRDQKDKRHAAAQLMHNKYAEPLPQIEQMRNRDVEEIKASYAYSLTSTEEFAFSVAFRTLCAIKSDAGPGGMAPNCRVFDELKTISGAASRAIQEVDDDF